jgi:hypothetical protein
MSTAQDQVVVLHGEEDVFYAVPRDVIEQHRVPAEAAGALRQIFADQADTSGYGQPKVFLCPAAIVPVGMMPPGFLGPPAGKHPL